MKLGYGGLFFLMLPAAMLLVGVFLIPLGSFLYTSFRELESIEQAFRILSSNTVLSSALVTAVIAVLTTVVVLLVGYPLAYGLLRSEGVWTSIIVCCIILPHFTSIIVRTYSWMVLLGRNGVINRQLLDWGVVEQPLQLMYNTASVVLGIGYVLLPYMVLTIYASMRAIDARLLQAASAMGASSFYTFRRVFLPLTREGVYGGVLIVFILALGSFVTPALMGGPRDLMIGMLIEHEVELSNNWPVASVLSSALLVVTLAIFVLHSKATRSNRLLFE